MLTPESVRLSIEGVRAQIPRHTWGIYYLMDADGEVVYVGKSQCLRRRLTDHIRRAGQSPRHMIRSFTWDPCDEHDPQELSFRECEAIGVYRPRWNFNPSHRC